MPPIDPLLIAQSWREQGQGVALATVIETWGSSPCPVGSQLAINQSGDFFGSVSGGCIEGEVIAQALDIISEGSAKTLQFGVADALAWQNGLSCGGRIRIYLEAIR